MFYLLIVSRKWNRQNRYVIVRRPVGGLVAVVFDMPSMLNDIVEYAKSSTKEGRFWTFVDCEWNFFEHAQRFRQKYEVHPSVSVTTFMERLIPTSNVLSNWGSSSSKITLNSYRRLVLTETEDAKRFLSPSGHELTALSLLLYLF